MVRPLVSKCLEALKLKLKQKLIKLFSFSFISLVLLSLSSECVILNYVLRRTQHCFLFTLLFSLKLTIGMPIPLTEIQDFYCVFWKDDRYHGNMLLGNTTATALDSNGTTLLCQTPDFNLSSPTINGN